MLCITTVSPSRAKASNLSSFQFRTLRVLTRSLVGKEPIDLDMLDLAFRVLVEAAHPDIADALTVHPVCQEELDNPGRDVSINPNENSILTPQRTVPDVSSPCLKTTLG